VQDLGDLGGGAAAAYAINDLGQVVGDSLTEAGESHAFLWTAAQGMQDLGLLILSEDPVERFSWAFSINNAGQVVGESGEYRGLSQPSRPFIWTQKTGMLDLTTFIANPPPAADYYFTDAIAINNSGQIAGNAIMLDSGSDHSYRLAPIAPVSTIFPLLLSD
jgi:probable HAF family extracellular repeat protein